ncbi:hypothetical protein PG985_008538 [Apiospora marii]|uniref:Uncharacterized protein n=1 Tax=Apiospora marii TaxID=335849 RepID=A0ABR1R2U4_9PEZI
MFNGENNSTSTGNCDSLEQRVVSQCQVHWQGKSFKPKGFFNNRFANDFQYYKSANNYLVITDIAKADPHGNKPRDVSRRADSLNAIFMAIFSLLGSRAHDLDEEEDISELVDHSEGNTIFDPKYLDRMKGEGSGPLRDAIKRNILIPTTGATRTR